MYGYGYGAVLGAGQSGKLAPPFEGVENQHFKLLIGEDYANHSWTTFSPDPMAGTTNKGALII